MRIIVCIKQVPKAQELQVDPVTQTLKRVGVPSEINPPDANALEIALQMKDRHGAEVIVLSMGPTSFDESLERAMAMGADRRRITSMVVWQGMRLALIGVVIGVGVSFWLSKLVASLLYGVKQWDPLVFVSVPLILSAVALVAVWLPAMRASKLNPMEALRTE